MNGDGWGGCVLAPSGKVVCIPRYNTHVGLFDPISNTFSLGIQITHMIGNCDYMGGVLLQSGEILFVPSLAYGSNLNICIYNPVNDTYRSVIVANPTSSTTPFAYGCLLADGRVLFFPNILASTYTTTIVGIFNPYNDGFTSFTINNPLNAD